jgi:uncharacterized membrane protein
VGTSVIGDLPDNLQADAVVDNQDQQPLITTAQTVISQAEISTIIPTNEDNTKVRVSAQLLGKIKKYLTNMAKEQFPFVDLLLFFPSLMLGGTLSAFASSISLIEFKGILFFIIFPIISIGLFVVYIFMKKDKIKMPAHDAQSLLDDYPQY